MAYIVIACAVMAYLVMAYVKMRTTCSATSIRSFCSYGRYSYGLYSYGLYSYGPYSYGPYGYGPYSYGLCQGENNLFSDLHPKLRSELLSAECADIIQNVTLFRDCRPRTIKRVLAHLKKMIFLPKEIVCMYGESAKEMFLIQRGEFEVIPADLYSYGLCSYGLCNYSLYSYGLYSYGLCNLAYIVMAYVVMA